MSQQLNCKDCGAPFEITDGEEEFYRGKGMNLPKRCKPCRIKKKAQSQNQDRGSFEDRRSERRSFEESGY